MTKPIVKLMEWWREQVIRLRTPPHKAAEYERGKQDRFDATINNLTGQAYEKGHAAGVKEGLRRAADRFAAKMKTGRATWHECLEEIKAIRAEIEKVWK